MQDLAKQPVWRRIPDDKRALMTEEKLPRTGIGVEMTLADIFDRITPYAMNSGHPRFWGWVQGSGFPLAAVADLIASSLNAHLAGFDHAPALVEQTTLGWLRQLMGFPVESSGVFCSSGTMANLLGLAVARAHIKPADPVLYASSEVHGWVNKALAVLGLPPESLRLIPAAPDFTMDAQALRKAITADRNKGRTPFCLIGTAGTVNTGAVDPLGELAGIAAGERLWFHVDGAFGALARLHPDLAPLLGGIENADSLAFDLHKWGSMPFACATLLVRDPAAHRAAFATTPCYMRPSQRGPLAGGVPFADRGIDLSRGFESLKVWVALRAFGVEHFAELIRQNVEDARQFAHAIEARPQFELLAPVALNIVCFRYLQPGVDLDAFNQELLLRLQESGDALISSTVIRGQVALRLANVNQRSTPEDFTMLLETLERLAAGIPAQ
jgi:glutamate/tyrosine decarboxylase-like PLP-dependent enzyme